MTENLKARISARRLTKSLALWLIGALTVAMLPLGLISVSQTSNVLHETERLSGVALMDRTQRAASRTQALIQEAFGAARTVAAANVLFEGGGVSCDSVLARLVKDSPTYLFAGFVDTEGQITCSSTGERRRILDESYFLNLLRDPQPRVDTRLSVALRGARVVRVSVPVYEASELRGFVVISIPYAAAYYTLDDGGAEVDLLVFDREGEFLTAEAAKREDGTDVGRLEDSATPESFEEVLPRDSTLDRLAAEGRQSFRGTNRLGEIRDFAVVPVIDDRIFVMGSWAPGRNSLAPTAGRTMALYFPILMWGAGIVVAYFAVHRLVIRHIKRLQGWMRLYASGHTDFAHARLDHAPHELEVVAEAFRSMTRRLAEQDRALEEDLAEKTILLKEVHHRVKNNLQLITSIMNMQIRNAHSAEARRLLKRVQDRVMALAAIHRYLYMARKLSMVRADRLLDDIIRQLVVVGDIDGTDKSVKIATQFSPVEVNPDQSVPLSLLATEAAINAVKYCRPPPSGGPAWITMALQTLDDGRVCLSVVNSRNEDPEPKAEPGDPESSGMGRQLISSFATQLDAEFEAHSDPDRYELHLTFRPLPASAEEEEEPETEEAAE
ncbi:histidine kinase [Rhodovulum sp. BSW8]|uniref:histidine kinase dimerization/phosphoacceptor domain -containing protein n=1 Tax=Rhodovulum sp. BSW8 TaxID=2259645 RepID=UPI000DE478FB|nr:histidine kinase dimerization/phosphoacceptor domain -containing protein [Rhodovulum sp. BSW8]RBO53356.1 histidine kinase [Rhodovulum sp. BSW8]